MKCGTYGHCSSGGGSSDKLNLILVIKIYVCSNSKLEGVEDSVAQKDEGVMSEVV